MSVAEVEAPIRLGPESNGMIMTPEEFDAVNDWNDAYRYELVHGVVVVSRPAGIGETNPNDELGHLLRAFRDAHAQGGSLDGTTFEHVVRTRAGRRRADRVIWVGLGRLPKARRDVPAIVIEFVSNSSRDRKRDYIDKRDEYAEAGVREYWVIVRFRRTMTVYRQKSQVRIVREDETYTTDLLPGFELPLSRLLAVADSSVDE